VPCFRPLKGYRSRHVNPDTGKRSIVFTKSEGYYDQPVDLACGQCIGCRLERSRQWAIRCVHEASLHEDNCFITLTYNDENLPTDRSLNVKHYQDFMKRLRFRFGSGIRFFHCGEYGERFSRPHYHACLFNFDFADKVKYKKTHSGDQLYTSQALNDLWPFGFSTVGSVSFESAAYVARYITKKVTGAGAGAHYEVLDSRTGELTQRKPEYTTMSRRPGIAKGWFEKFSSDVYPSDFVVIRERIMKPPKYYDRQFELAYPSDFDILKRVRKKRSLALAEKQPESRLAVREQVQNLKFKLLKRGYENET